MTPVLAFKLRPVGSEPELTEYTYGEFPPLATIVVLYTTRVVPPGNGGVVSAMLGQVVTVKHAEYSEVLLVVGVAVAVIIVPTGRTIGKVIAKLAVPVAFVAVVPEPT